MPATGTEVASLSQIKTVFDNLVSRINGKQDALSLPLSVEQGGTGSTSASAALTALGGATAASVNGKLDAPGEEGEAGQVLTWNGSATEWSTVSAGTTYTGSNGVTVSGSVISGVDAGENTKGVVAFASDSDFNEYFGIS